MTNLTATRKGWTAKYKGGPYIDLHVHGHCMEVINIMDYATGKLRMEPTQKAVARELREWMEENAENLPTYEEHARYYR